MTPVVGRRGSVPSLLLAGWLFADLLLGLTIIMLGAQAPPPLPAKPLAGKGSASPSASPSPSPCATRAAGVAAKPTKVSFRVNTGASDAELLGAVRRELLKHKKRLSGRHAGMVLTFGANGGAGEGVHLATRVNAAAGRAFPGIFQTAATRNFHDLAAPSGSISMEIYFVSGGCSPITES
ncbi:hypothetical protein OG320_27125 [Microbispora sp. NBC_01189]|uniref:hypothetical protein n=1 Tax=Microbispora sp. NBC_01189 TaxID=2903583 RepID=UPI002E165E62|nr:hypothetical protein OG320_27125 [Microbispora sp. NBC_01189]